MMNERALLPQLIRNAGNSDQQAQINHNQCVLASGPLRTMCVYRLSDISN